MLGALTRVPQYSIATRKGEERVRDHVPGKLRTGEERES